MYISLTWPDRYFFFCVGAEKIESDTFLIPVILLHLKVLIIGTRYTSSTGYKLFFEAVSSIKLSQNKRKQFCFSFLEEMQLKTRRNC